MDFDLLAAELVERLAPAVPSSIRVVAVGTEIELSTEVPTDGRVVMDVSAFGPLPGVAGYELEPTLRAACLHVLDTVQDYVAETTTDPWPGTTVMPEPVVEVDEGVIVLSYATADETVLAFAPIPRF